MIQTPRLASSAENEAAASVFGTGPDFAPAKMATRTCLNVGLNGLVFCPGAHNRAGAGG